MMRTVLPLPSLRGLLSIAAAALLVAAGSARSADAPSVVIDPILVQRGNVTIRKSDFEAEMLRIPEKDRQSFLAGAKRVREFIDRMMMTLELAEVAKAKGLDKDPIIARRVELEQGKVLAQAYLADVEATARRDFDAKLPAAEAAARESYLADKATRYSKPEAVMISQLNIRIDGSPESAKARADEAYSKLKAGADFGDMAEIYAENPANAKLRGLRGPLARTDLDAELVPIVFGTAKLGEVNPPVRVGRNWTIVRVNSRIPASTQSFDEVKASIIERMRDEYVTHARDAALAALGAGKKAVVNEPAIEALRTPAGARN
jgi:parvulin-like peptidyl-prolyl isomerase